MVEVMVAVWCKLTYGEYGFSSMGIGPIPGIQYRVVELNCVALLQGSEMSP